MRMQTFRAMKTVLAASLALCGMTAALAQTPTPPPSLTPQQQRFHDIYKELVEINTTHSVGDNTVAARAMEKRLIEAGFAPGDIQIFEPFPKKGNLVLRFKGDGSKKPLLLLAHIDVVEARREDWKTDPFKLQETGGYFTARGSIDDKAMASALVSVVGQLKQEGFKPKRDIILALTADEERGDALSNGAFWLINNKPELLQAEFGIHEVTISAQGLSLMAPQSSKAAVVPWQKLTRIEEDERFYRLYTQATERFGLSYLVARHSSEMDAAAYEAGLQRLLARSPVKPVPRSSS